MEKAIDFIQLVVNVIINIRYKFNEAIKYYPDWVQNLIAIVLVLVVYPLVFVAGFFIISLVVDLIGSASNYTAPY